MSTYALPLGSIRIFDGVEAIKIDILTNTWRSPVNNEVLGL